MSHDTSNSTDGMIIIDDVTSNPVLDFEAYSNTIVKMIRQSLPKFSIGIYGEWGTGKTTLMKVIESKLRAVVNEDVFIWNDLHQNNDEIARLKAFLKKYYKADWIDNSLIERENDRTLSLYDTNIIRKVDEKGTYQDESLHLLTLQLSGKKDKASLTIDQNFIGTFSVKEENNKLKLHLQQNEILTVWFNAWRYEREDQFAIVALLKTIGFAMSKHPIYKELKPILLNAVKIISKGFLSEIASSYIGEKGVEEFKTKLLPKMEFLSELDKDTIYFDDIYKIENEMRRILEDNPSTRVVVFIDDLDRCSPEKALEVFESVKVFLGLEGFVYVIGLSHVTISNLITAKHKEIGIKGEQYIKKIIQVPVMLPEWNVRDVGILLDDLLKQNLIGEKYRDIIKNNSELVCEIVENNPRELKRFITSYVVASEIHQSYNEKIDPKQLLLIQVLNVRWSKFYQILVGCPKEVRNEIFRYVDMRSDQRNRVLKISEEFSPQNTSSNMESEKIEESYPLQAKLILQKFR